MLTHPRPCSCLLAPSVHWLPSHQGAQADSRDVRDHKVRPPDLTSSLSLVSSFHPDPSVPCTYREDDAKWPKKDVVGKQELEIRVGNDHISFEVRLLPFSPSLLTSLPCSARLLRSLLGRLARQTSKIGSLVDVQDSEDPEGLRVFYYLVQDLKVSSPSTLLLPSLPFPSR